MLDILSLLLQTKPIEVLTPSVAKAYYEPIPEEPSTTIVEDPLANNCYAYVAQFVRLPLAQQIIPNTTPQKGAVAIFQYKVPHYALVVSLEETGFWITESNYTAGVIGKRFIKWDDPHLKGFYSPTSH